MKKIVIVLSILFSITAFNPAFAEESVVELKRKIAELQAQVDAHKADRAKTARHLEMFDELDLEAFNHRNMKQIGEVHADDIIVHNPDGTQTSPLPPHADELQFFNTFDFKVTDDIVGFGYREWTAGISISEGKWVKPITLPNGTVLQPTGKKVKLKIAHNCAMGKQPHC